MAMICIAGSIGTDVIRSQILCDVCGMVGETQNRDNKFHLMRHELRKRGWTRGERGRDYYPRSPGVRFRR